MNTNEQQVEDPFHILDELSQLIKSSPRYWTQVSIDEAGFFNATSRLKMRLYDFKQASPTLQAQRRQNLTAIVPFTDIFRLIDELEQSVESGKGYFSGRVFVNAERPLNQIDKIRQALPQDRVNITAMMKNASIGDASPQTDKILAEAKAEAMYSIEAAHDNQQMARTLQILDKLAQMAEKGPRFGEWVVLDEEAFFRATADFKKATPESIKQADRILRAQQRNHPEAATEYVLATFRLVDELEQLVEQGKAHLFGRVLVDAEQFKALLSKMRQALPQDLENAAKIVEGSVADDASPQTDKIIGAAKAEADHIIAVAQTEAARIIAGAYGTRSGGN